MENIWNYLKEKELLDWVDTPPKYTLDQLETELGYALPTDYKEIMGQCYCFSIEGEEQIDFFEIGEVISFTTEMFYMAPLRGILLIGTDRGGNMIGYDPHNRIGKGAFHIYYFGRTELTFGDAIPLGANLREVADLCNDPEMELFNSLPSISQEGIKVVENPRVPDIKVESLSELTGALPETAVFKGVLASLQLKEEEGRVTGGYYAHQKDAVFLYSFGRNFQELYNNFAQALLAYGNDLPEIAE